MSPQGRTDVTPRGGRGKKVDRGRHILHAFCFHSKSLPPPSSRQGQSPMSASSPFQIPPRPPTTKPHHVLLLHLVHKVFPKKSLPGLEFSPSLPHSTKVCCFRGLVFSPSTMTLDCPSLCSGGAFRPREETKLDTFRMAEGTTDQSELGQS